MCLFVNISLTWYIIHGYYYLQGSWRSDRVKRVHVSTRVKRIFHNL